jgi:hypothetical protein
VEFANALMCTKNRTHRISLTWSASRTMGVSRPRSVATATLMSTLRCRSMASCVRACVTGSVNTTSVAHNARTHVQTNIEWEVAMHIHTHANLSPACVHVRHGAQRSRRCSHNKVVERGFRRVGWGAVRGEVIHMHPTTNAHTHYVRCALPTRSRSASMASTFISIVR